MEIFKSNKGGFKLAFEGYVYTVEKVLVNSVRWRCAERPLHKCRGIVKSDLDYKNPVLTKEHNHIMDVPRVSCMKVLANLKTKAKEGSCKPSELYAKGIADLEDAAREVLANEETVKRDIRQQRAGRNPAEPDDLKDLLLKDEWTQTIGPSPAQFLINDNGPEAENRIIVFASTMGLQKLATSSSWFMDGNFSLAPKNFCQLYVIRVPLGRSGAVSVVYAILQRKTMETYKELLQTILAICSNQELFPDPRTVVCDFEIGVMSAVKKVLGEHVNIQGCFYYLTQSTWRKIQELGLTVCYKEDEDCRKFCAKLDALAFLPVADVKAGMSLLRTIAHTKCTDLVDYFDATYVNGAYRRLGCQAVGVLGLRMRALPPRYSPDLWNVHQATLDNNPRTNNICEGWNHKFSHLVSHNHPTIWKLIRSLQLEECGAATAMLQLENLGLEPKTRTRRVYADMQTRLRDLCIGYNRKERSLESFIDAISNNIRHRQNDN